MTSHSRMTALDGLRGVAALVVVAGHCMLISPVMAAAFYGPAQDYSWWRWLLVYTPLHLLWGGAEAVILFFVLSGFVLARSVRSPRFNWFAYVPARMVRLYVPVVAAVIAGWMIITLLPHDGAPASPWLDRVQGYPVHDMVQDMVLLNGTSGVVSPLWSLKWEVLFSLLLPLAMYATRLIPAWMLGVASIALSTWGVAEEVSVLKFLPVFGVGVALAGMWDGLTAWAQERTSMRAQVGWAFALLMGLGMLGSYWPLYIGLHAGPAHTISQPLLLVGAAVVIVAAVHFGPLRRLLSWRPVAWLGGISFSLYLVHEPIVIWMANVTDAARYTLLAAVPLSLAAAWVFWLIIEHPVHLLSRHVRDNAALMATGQSVPASDSQQKNEPDADVHGRPDSQDTRPLDIVQSR